MEELERLLESSQLSEALERFKDLHPVDQGEILDGLPRRLSRSLLVELNASVVANILEFMEPEESAGLIGDRLPAEVAEVLDLTDIDVPSTCYSRFPRANN